MGRVKVNNSIKKIQKEMTDSKVCKCGCGCGCGCDSKDRK
jgi:hypothetical protein